MQCFRLIILCLFVFLPYLLKGQINSDDSTLKVEEFLYRYCENEKSFSMSSKDSTFVVVFRDKFTLNTLLGPSNNSTLSSKSKHIDSNYVLITLTYDSVWTYNYYNDVRQSNENNLSKLKELYIAYYDEKGWQGKHSQVLFLENPVHHIKKSHFKDHPLFKKLKRLPDFRISNYGFFIDSSVDFSIYYISEPKVRSRLQDLIVNLIRLDSYINRAFDMLPNY